MSVVTGAERLLSNPAVIPEKRWGLVTNYTAVTRGLELTAVELHRSTSNLAAILSPEHGLRGTAQAGFAEASQTDHLTGLPVLDTYGLSEDDLDRQISALHLDAMVADIQDVGARFYTYVWTVVDCMRSAARLGIPFYVLDRPNPISGAVSDGPGLLPDYSSFVGRLNVPIRHGLTLGELARQGAAESRAAGIAVPDPTVVTMTGWNRKMYWEETGLPWVMPSPNLPTPETALAYVGTCFFEGTNMSEGRGTTRPFELVGAPWLDERYALELNGADLPGVRFRATSFIPTFSKHAGASVTGAQLHVTDRAAFQPIPTGVAMLRVAAKQGEGRFEWRMPAWEDEGARKPFVDLLWGSDSLRVGLDLGAELDQIMAEAPRAVSVSESLLY